MPDIFDRFQQKANLSVNNLRAQVALQHLVEGKPVPVFLDPAYIRGALDPKHSVHGDFATVSHKSGFVAHVPLSKLCALEADPEFRTVLKCQGEPFWSCVIRVLILERGSAARISQAKDASD